MPGVLRAPPGLAMIAHPTPAIHKKNLLNCNPHVQRPATSAVQTTRIQSLAMRANHTAAPQNLQATLYASAEAMAMASQEKETPVEAAMAMASQEKETPAEEAMAMASQEKETPAEAAMAMASQEKETPVEAAMAMASQEKETPVEAAMAMASQEKETPVEEAMAMASQEEPP